MAKELALIKGVKVSSYYLRLLITPHAQRERGKVIGRGVHIYQRVR